MEENIKKLEVDLKIKNIDELQALVEQLNTTVDNIKNFKLEVEASRCEHNQDIHH